jgi:LysM repeat protein
VAVQPFQLPLDSLFSARTEPVIPDAAPGQTSPRRLAGVGRTVIAIAATSVFFGGAGSVYMHAAMGHTVMTGAMPAGDAAMAPAPAMAAPVPAVGMPEAAPDPAPPRPHSEGTSMPATSAVTAPEVTAPAVTATAPAEAAPKSTAMTSSAAPSLRSTSSGSSASVRVVTVGEGDSFSTLAARYGVSQARIAALNPDVDSTSLQIGQSLRVRW